jgi:hypothetical protein
MAPVSLTVDFLVLHYILLHCVASKTLISPNLEGRSIYLVMWLLRGNFLVLNPFSLAWCVEPSENGKKTAPCGMFSLMFTFRFVLSRVSRCGMVLGVVCAVYGQSSAGDAEATESATRLVKLYRVWGPALSSFDASISLKELSRSGPVIKYRLFAKGLPHESTYTLVEWPVTQMGPTENLQGVTLDESGQAICAGRPDTCGSPEKPNDPIDLVLSPVKGEPFRLALVSDGDKNVKAFLKAVPVPNGARDRGCLLDAILLMPHGELVEIEGSGFEPNSDLEMESKSGKEHHVKTVKASSEGRYECAILPFVKGEQYGVTHVKIKAAKCSPELSFEWGRQN